MKNLKVRINKISKEYLYLIVILAVGIFLRTYNFGPWMHFGFDQLRDAKIVDGVVKGSDAWPQIGPTMRKSGISEDKLFHLGPVYYDLQIASAKIFGSSPVNIAYPNLLFSLLALPLFYFFLRKYFETKISLTLTALYATSYFSILYARYTWNPNLIPFFVLLFLLGLYEFLIKEEKVSWTWIVLLAVAMGIGVQLHAIIIVVFGFSTLVVFGYLLKKNPRLWKKIFTVVFLVLLLNIGQIKYDAKHDFSNAKAFFNFSSTNNNSGIGEFGAKTADNLYCQTEAINYILFSSSGFESKSSGADSCSFSYGQIFDFSKFAKVHDKGIFLTLVIFGFAFALAGYVLLGYFFGREKDLKRKKFLGLILVYILGAAVAMFPIIAGGFKEYRYFLPIFFVPLFMTGLLFVLIKQKAPKLFLLFAIACTLFILFTNSLTISRDLQEYLHRSATNSDRVVLGEIAAMQNFMEEENQKIVYLSGEVGALDGLYGPIAYLFAKQDLELMRVDVQQLQALEQEKNLYYLAALPKKKNSIVNEIAGRKIIDQKLFGNFIIYKLEN